MEPIWAVVREIPPGRVASYGQVARLAGLPRGARQVGRALSHAPASLRLPWHRVLGSDGRISLPAGSGVYRQQVRLLRREGVEVINGRVRLRDFQWQPDADGRRQPELDALLWGPAVNERSTRPTVCFSHGQESGPWGTKITRLAEIARECGYPVESLDYRGMPDPEVRAEHLVRWCEAQERLPVLVGSSMGGYVALAAAAHGAHAVFLLAPALYVPGYEHVQVPPPPRCPLTIVHGWQDEVLPWSGSVRYGEESRARVILVPGDHRLAGALEEIGRLFRLFLSELPNAPAPRAP